MQYKKEVNLMFVFGLIVGLVIGIAVGGMGAYIYLKEVKR
jgi:hypothetical protein